MNSFRTAFVATTWFVATLVLGNVALAEGSRTSFVEDVLTGFNSGTWNDRQRDNDATRITFRNCRINDGGAPDTFESVTLELRQVNEFRPDDSYGTETLRCAGAAIGDWGRVREKSHYKFRINLINGRTCCQSMDADPVIMRW